MSYTISRRFFLAAGVAVLMAIIAWKALRPER